MGWLVAGLALAGHGWAAETTAPAPVTTPEPVAVSAAYQHEIDEWRTQRRERLLKADGWLTLIGLHFLQPGENTVGTAKDNSVVLAKGPEHLGTVTIGDGGLAHAVFNPGLNVRVGGEEVFSADMRDDVHGASTIATVDAVSVMVIDRGGKKALRVKDSESDRRTHFLGLDYFPVDPAWRIEAQWVPFEKPREVPISDIIGNTSPALILGKAVFTREGHTMELIPIQDDPDGVLFFVISDLTSGEETYGAARFVYAAPPVDGKVILDFNKAQNPPCAFTPFATCPLPPKENRLPIAVRAGEKNYRGHE